MGLSVFQEVFAALLLLDPALRDCAEARFVSEILPPEIGGALNAGSGTNLTLLPSEVLVPILRQMSAVALDCPTVEERRRALYHASSRARLDLAERAIEAKKAELQAHMETEERLLGELRNLYGEQARLRARSGFVMRPARATSKEQP